jgi:hypothetical protein
MIKRASKVLLFSFPVGFIGAMANCYASKEFNNFFLGDIGIFSGILIGGVMTVFFGGFFIFVHLKLICIPKDLFTGPMIGDNASIFRNGIAGFLCLVGSGIGFIYSASLFMVNTLGIGISLLTPGVIGSALLIGLWKRCNE